MRTTLSKCARRAAIGWCAILFVALAGAAAACASELTETADFADVATAVTQYADKLKPERVLLVLDIDNTLLAMNNPLGSDQWFEWQKFLLENEPKSRHAVANSFQGLLDAQGMLYNLTHMHPPQKNLPAPNP